MSAGQRIASALSRVRQSARALRALELGERAALVGRVLEAWSEPEGPWQRRLVTEHAAHTGFAEETVRRGLALGLADWKAAALGSAVEAEAHVLSMRDGSRSEPFEATSVLLAGSIPMPSILQLLSPLVVGSPVLAKAASRDRVTPICLHDSLRKLAPEFAACVEVVEPEDEEDARAFFSAPCVVASGSDATIRAVRERLRGGQRLIAHPNKLSIAVVGNRGLDATTADAVALDVALWDQLGCLSPIALYLVGASEDRADHFAGELARALDGLELEMPQGQLGDAVAAELRGELEDARVRIAMRGRGVLRESADPLRWTVVREADAEPRPAPLHRFVRIHCVADEASLGRALAPLGSLVSTVALSGFDKAREKALCERFAALGASRVCRPGQMQRPPLDWHHDGYAPFGSLVRRCDLDI